MALNVIIIMRWSCLDGYYFIQDSYSGKFVKDILIECMLRFNSYMLYDIYSS